MLYVLAYAVQFRERAHFGGPVGEFSPTMEIVPIFLECVRDEGATDQFVIGDKVTRITNCISPDNSSIRAEKIIRPRPDDVPFAFLMPSIVPSDIVGTQLEVMMHIEQSGICQNIGNRNISV